MRKFLLAVFLGFILIIAGCSGLTGKSSNPEVDKSGYGLEVQFSMDPTDIKRMKVYYTLSLYNTGLEPIVLNVENTKLTTKQVLSGEYGIRDVFTDESMQEFYNKLFPNGELKLEHDAKHVSSGVLIIEKEFFDDLNNEALEYSFDLNYDYKTSFANNLELNYKNEMYKLNVLDTVSQAAPIQITGIKLIPAMKSDEYVLEYYVSDKGKSSDISPATKIDDMNIVFRDNSLGGSCKGSYENKKNLELSEIVVRKGDNLVLECPIILVEKESFTTKTFGEFSYNYKMRFVGKIKMPRDN